MPGIKRWLDAALELIFPPRRLCPLCGGHSPGAAVCPQCRELLAGYAGERVCPLCGSYPYRGGVRSAGGATAGLPVGRREVPRAVTPWCSDCRAGRPFALARSVGAFEGPLREAVYRLKYRGATWQARPMAALMAEVFARQGAFAGCGGLLPVPLHSHRERRRGFNQATLLARCLGEITGVPVLERAAARIRETPPQTSLDRQSRLRNLQGAFAVTRPDLIKGKIITVVDDVITTGSTVSILSQQLRQAGAAEVLVLTFAAARQTGKN